MSCKMQTANQYNFTQPVSQANKTYHAIYRNEEVLPDLYFLPFILMPVLHVDQNNDD